MTNLSEDLTGGVLGVPQVPITVLMPVLNGESWIAEAVQSLVSQSHENFELLLVDGGSTDDSVPIARDIAGDRIRVVTFPDRGVAASLAYGIRVCDTEFVSRLDSDDRSRSTRLSRQVGFLTQNPEYVIVGSNIDFIDMTGRHLGSSRFPTSDPAIRLRMVLGNPFAHSAVTFRKSAVAEVGNYWSPDSSPFPEDYHLWCRLARVGKLANLTEFLTEYRINQAGLVRTNLPRLRNSASEISLTWLSEAILERPLDPSEKEAWVACFGSPKRISLWQSLQVGKLLIEARKRFLGEDCSGAIRSRNFAMPFFRVLLSR